jgi:hypothetical protein
MFLADECGFLRLEQWIESLDAGIGEQDADAAGFRFTLDMIHRGRPLVQEVPISTPVPKTNAPPNATWVAADRIGVSM